MSDLNKKSFKDLTRDEKMDHVFKHGSMERWMQCPCCGHTYPLKVKCDIGGNPLSKESGFIYFKNVDGMIYRRFYGPPDGYMPVQTVYKGGRYGSYIKTNESFTPQVLNRVDHELFLDFKDAVDRCRMVFDF